MSAEPDISSEGEVVDGLPVPTGAGAGPRAGAARRAPLVPAVQAAALAATGFVAGAATVAVVARRRAQPSRRRRKKGKGAIGEIVGSNSFLVDVHLVRRD